jgi:hypothetical protein
MGRVRNGRGSDALCDEPASWLAGSSLNLAPPQRAGRHFNAAAPDPLFADQLVCRAQCLSPRRRNGRCARPRVDTTQIRPPCISMICLAMATRALPLFKSTIEKRFGAKFHISHPSYDWSLTVVGALVSLLRSAIA